MSNQNLGMTPESIVRSYNQAKESRRLWESHWIFSCWNANDPNLKKIIAVQPGHRIFECCLRIARRAVSGCLQDITNGATHYHTHRVNPPWSRGHPACVEIGRHLFYNQIE